MLIIVENSKPLKSLIDYAENTSESKFIEAKTHIFLTKFLLMDAAYQIFLYYTL